MNDVDRALALEEKKEAILKSSTAEMLQDLRSARADLRSGVNDREKVKSLTSLCNAEVKVLRVAFDVCKHFNVTRN